MQDGYVTAGFNALNQPTAIWSKMYQNTSNWMFFGYDPLGRCVKRWVSDSFNDSTGTTFFFYDGWNLIQEGPNAAATNRLYVHGARVDEIVASQVDGTWYYHHYDAQGNCILQSMANGGIQAQYDYDAFGFPYFYNAAGGKGTPKTRFLFTGREYLSDLRLYDYRNRMYQPELGRFLQPDPKEFEAGDYNLYRYCHNDPVNKTDPTRLIDEGHMEAAALEGAVQGSQNLLLDIGHGLDEMLRNPGTDPMGLVSQWNAFQRDWMWDMAAYGDSGNSFQGGWNDFNQALHPQAGPNGGGGGAPQDGGKGKPISSGNEGPKGVRNSQDSSNQNEPAAVQREEMAHISKPTRERMAS
jgi:RHS repeat-associated protein